jgi:hypothetical protein
MTQELWKGNVINNCACQYRLLPCLCITSGCLHPLAVYILWLCLSSGWVYRLAVYNLCLFIHNDSRTMEWECDNQLRMSVRTPSMWPSLVRWVPPKNYEGETLPYRGICTRGCEAFFNNSIAYWSTLLRVSFISTSPAYAPYASSGLVYPLKNMNMYP